MDASHLRVLLVEDSPGDARLLREAVRTAPGVQVELVWANTLQGGLQHLDTENIDLVLLDLGLPDSHGLDTFLAVRDAAPQTAVVVLSGMADEDLALQAVHRGAQDYLVKGEAEPSSIVRAMRYAVERQRADQHIRHLNAILSAIRNVNQLISRQTDREPLLRGVCDEIHSSGAGLGVWLLHLRAPDMHLHQAGQTDLPPQEMLMGPDGHLAACLRQAVATEGVVIFADKRPECHAECLCSSPLGCVTLMTRIHHDRRTYGVLGVRLARALATDPDEQNLFEELALDVAYALHSLDIAEQRHKAERALRQEERKFRALFDKASDAIFIHGLGGRILEVNRAATQHLGYRRRDLRARRLQELEAPGYNVLESQWLQTLRQLGYCSCETVCVRHDGTNVPLELNSTLIRYDGESAVLTSARDISVRKQAEETQRLAAVGQLAAGVAHEYNNLLASLSARAQTVAAYGTPESVADLIEAVRRLAARGCEIGRDLMSFARPREPQREALQPEEPIEAALLLAERELENSEIQVVRDYQVENGRIFADRWQIQQVLLNLIINASQAMAEGGALTLETRLEAPTEGTGEIVIRVSDDGDGILPENLSRIFEPFFSTKGRHGESPHPGAGLGLFVSRGLVHANGGAISVSSRLAAGTCFELRFPQYEGLVLGAADETEPAEDDASSAGRGTVLLAMGPTALRQDCATRLLGHGYEVLTAETMSEVLRGVSRGRPEAVICDLALPEADARQLLQLASYMLRRPSVVFIAAEGQAELTDELLSHGASAVLGPETTARELAGLVQRLTANSGGA